ncbi:50S ribosomal protein L15 [Clostridia bacterium]|nr:50S ribosomal protein L15 [Clostridia bacterium]
MQLHQLTAPPGSNRDVKRIGRGHGSGQGKTAGKGHKGQWARSGGGVRPGFEGGQQPLARRIPKRGFKNLFRTEYAVINLAELDKRFESGAVITEDELIDSGIIKKPLAGVKVLGKGELTKSFTVKATAFSASAKEKIEKAGGKTELSWEEQPGA